MSGVEAVDRGEPVPVCLAVDIGGTKLAVGLVDSCARVKTSDQARTPKTGGGDGLFQVLADLIEVARGEASAHGMRVVTCGVGSGGPMEPRGVSISPLNIPAWREFPLRSRLESLPSLNGVPVFVDNDAKALALGEMWAGSGRGVRNFLAMVVSTGIGGGIVLDGRVLAGRSGNAGHVGHVIVEPDGRRCRCGSRGCLEAEVSGSAIEEITGRPAAEAPPEIVERTGLLVGRAIASAANLLDFRLALIGGSVALGYGTSFFDAAQRELDERARISYVKRCVVQAVGLGACGPLIGAAGVGWRGIGRLVPVPEDGA